VANLACDGYRRRSLLHGCYTVDLVGAGRRANQWLPGTGTQNLQLQCIIHRCAQLFGHSVSSGQKTTTSEVNLVDSRSFNIGDVDVLVTPVAQGSAGFEPEDSSSRIRIVFGSSPRTSAGYVHPGNQAYNRTVVSFSRAELVTFR
jgi:hypothetical protein